MLQELSARDILTLHLVDQFHGKSKEEQIELIRELLDLISIEHLGNIYLKYVEYPPGKEQQPHVSE